MVHHFALGKNDLETSTGVLRSGRWLLKKDDKSLDYGIGAVLFSLETPVNSKPATPGNGVHVAVMAEDPAMVDEFYGVALEHGGTDDGSPGLRTEYNPNYYGAFVLDPMHKRSS